MHPRMEADLIGAGITSPEMLMHAISHATASATNAPRLTPSRRYRRWKVVAARWVVFLVVAAGWMATR